MIGFRCIFELCICTTFILKAEGKRASLVPSLMYPFLASPLFFSINLVFSTSNYPFHFIVSQFSMRDLPIQKNQLRTPLLTSILGNISIQPCGFTFLLIMYVDRANYIAISPFKRSESARGPWRMLPLRVVHRHAPVLRHVDERETPASFETSGEEIGESE